MYTYIEIWNAKPAWLALSQQQRQEYMNNVGETLQELVKQGIEPISMGFNDPDTAHRANYDFFAVWNVPNKEAAEALEKAVNDAGWHEYFEQHNVRGETGTPDRIIGHHITM